MRIIELKTITSEKQYQLCLNWLDEQFDAKVNADTPEGEKVKAMLLLVKQYEDAHYAVPLPASK